MGEQDLAVRSNQDITIRDPQAVVDEAMKAAKVLQSVIGQKAKPVIMNGEQYLEFEDWQTVGQFYGFSVATHDAVPVEIGGVSGAKAQADLLNRDGQKVGSAEAYCLRDEDKWSTRTKYEWRDVNGKREKVKVGEETVPWFQLASMAQTRAAAKAMRNRLAWVVVLAGYRPTPAEEMTGAETPRAPANPDGPHYCQEHKTEFFKRGKMRSFAHPIAGQDGQWCYEHTASPPQTVEGKATPAGEAVDPRTLKFKNPGEFYSACHNVLDMARSAVDPLITMYDIGNPEQRSKAWLFLVDQKTPQKDPLEAAGL